MAPPLVTIYVTSLTSQPKVRKHIELLRRSLKGLEIAYEEYDLVMDEEAKTRWQRSKPPGAVVGLPGYLVGGEWVGTMDDFEDAVETQSLETFLKQDLDLSAGSTTTSGAGAADAAGGAQKTVQEVELEKLMRDMTDVDLDKLMDELNVEPSSQSRREKGEDQEEPEAEKEITKEITQLHGGETVDDAERRDAKEVKVPSSGTDTQPSSSTKDDSAEPGLELISTGAEIKPDIDVNTGGSESIDEAIKASIIEKRAISDIKDVGEERTVLDELKEELLEDDKEEREIQSALQKEKE